MSWVTNWPGLSLSLPCFVSFDCTPDIHDLDSKSRMKDLGNETEVVKRTKSF